MRKHKMLCLAGICFCGALVFAQTLPPAVPSKHEGGLRSLSNSKSDVATRIFHLEGKEYVSLMTWQDAQSAPAWDPSSPLPVSLAQAEEIARKELSKLVSDEIRWQFSDFSISRFRVPTTNGQNWYFAITLKPALAVGEVNSDFFTLLMNSSGEPGRIGQRAGKTQ